MGQLPLLTLPPSKVQGILSAASMTQSSKMLPQSSCRTTIIHSAMSSDTNSSKTLGSDSPATRNLILLKRRSRSRSTQTALSSQMKQSRNPAPNSMINSSNSPTNSDRSSRSSSERMAWVAESRLFDWEGGLIISFANSTRKLLD